MEDTAIIGLYWDRDERAIRESDLKYGNYCYTVADNILDSREDSEECVSDTWLRAWNVIPPKRPRILRAFLARITRNLAFDRYRARGAARRGGGVMDAVLDELGECADENWDTEQEVEAGELRQAIREFVRRLKEKEANIFVRRYFFADSIPEICDRYGLKPNNVTVSLSRTRAKLRKYLEEEGFIG